MTTIVRPSTIVEPLSGCTTMSTSGSPTPTTSSFRKPDQSSEPSSK